MNAATLKIINGWRLAHRRHGRMPRSRNLCQSQLSRPPDRTSS
jgi:hypothetical protein